VHCSSLLELSLRLRCKEATEAELLVFDETVGLSKVAFSYHDQHKRRDPGDEGMERETNEWAMRRRDGTVDVSGEEKWAPVARIVTEDGALSSHTNVAVGVGANRVDLGALTTFSERTGNWAVDTSHPDRPTLASVDPLLHQFPTTTDGWVCGPYFIEGDWAAAVARDAKYMDRVASYLGAFYDAGDVADGTTTFGKRGPEAWFMHADVVGDGRVARRGWDSDFVGEAPCGEPAEPATKKNDRTAWPCGFDDLADRSFAARDFAPWTPMYWAAMELEDMFFGAKFS